MSSMVQYSITFNSENKVNHTALRGPGDGEKAAHKHPQGIKGYSYHEMSLDGVPYYKSRIII